MTDLTNLCLSVDFPLRCEGLGVLAMAVTAWPLFDPTRVSVNLEKKEIGISLCVVVLLVGHSTDYCEESGPFLGDRK
jgi:hypothetical protein